MSRDRQSTPPNAHNSLSPAEQYVMFVARSTVEAHHSFGTEAVARWNAPPAGTVLVNDPADLPGALVFAYDLAVRQIEQLLSIVDSLVAS